MPYTSAMCLSLKNRNKLFAVKYYNINVILKQS